MTAQTKPHTAATVRGEGFYQNKQAQNNRKRPPYSREFSPGPNRQAFLAVGWPPKPVRRAMVCLPPDQHPAEFAWQCLRDTHVFVFAAADAEIPESLAVDLSRELIVAGVSSVAIESGGEWWRNAEDRPEVPRAAR